jgi:hypothetical protein
MIKIWLTYFQSEMVGCSQPFSKPCNLNQNCVYNGQSENKACCFYIMLFKSWTCANFTEQVLKIQLVFKEVSFSVENLLNFCNRAFIPVRWQFLCHLYSHGRTALCCDWSMVQRCPRRLFTKYWTGCNLMALGQNVRVAAEPFLSKICDGLCGLRWCAT